MLLVTVVQAGTPGASATDQVSRAALNHANQKALKDAAQTAQDQRDIDLIKIASDGADKRTKSMIDGLQSFMNPKTQPSQDAAAEFSVHAAKRKVDALKYKLRIFPKEGNIYKNALKEIVSFSSGVHVDELSDDVMSEINVEDVLKYS